jgi:hypothetical protein
MQLEGPRQNLTAAELVAASHFQLHTSPISVNEGQPRER